MARRSTLKTLIHVTRALAAEDGDQPAVPGKDAPATPGGLQSLARRAAETVRQAPRLQGRAAHLGERLRGGVHSLKTAAQDRADTHLERLVTEAGARRGGAAADVTALLDARRQEREARQRALAARDALLAHAQTTHERRVLTLVAAHTAWAGGEAPGALRYTVLLDTLAPGGRAEDEMKVHRALWTLAEEEVLAVSPHGVITAGRPLAFPAPVSAR